MRVGIIGGGISGLATARGLLKYGIECVVFDTGKRGVGGRCSSRLGGDGTNFPGAVDHAAQFVEVSGDCEAFGAFVDDCVEDGVLAPWSGYEGGDGRRLFVGSAAEGIGALPAALAAGVDVRQDVWVSPNGGVRFDRESKRWVANKEQFDAVVIAHNGKCAERITSKIPSAPVRNLCKAAFGTKPAKGRMTLNSVYSLVFETRKGALDGAPVAQKFGDDAVLAFLGNNGRKLGWATEDDATEVFTALSTGEYGKKNKHPQEQLQGTDVETRVTRELLDAVADACGAEPLEPLRAKLQLWGAAVPLNRWASDAPFAWDGAHKIGVVGDWLYADLPSCVEAAFASGDGLAAHLRDAPGDDRGLQGSFAAATSDFSTPRRGAAAAAAAPPKPSTKTPEQKRVVKLKKALKRIGQLRLEDYATLKTEQRVKIHGEADVLDELRTLGVDADALRLKLQPGLPNTMPRSRAWSKERDDAREKQKAEDARNYRPPAKRRA